MGLIRSRIALVALGLFAASPLGCGGGSKPRTGAPTTPTASPTPPGPATPPATGDAEPAYVAEGHPASDLISRRVFFGDPDRAGVQISPDGKHLSWLAQNDGVLNVWVAPIDDLDKARPVTADKARPVTTYFWAYTGEHILYIQDSGGDENWRVYSVAIDSGKKLDITPAKGKVQARILAVSHLQPRKVVIGVNDRVPQLHDLYTVDLTDGKSEKLLENPGFAGFEIDDHFAVRLGVRTTPDGGTELMKPAKKAGKAKKAANGEPDPFAGWQSFMKIASADALSTGVIGFDKSGRHAFMWDSRDRDTRALRQIDMRTGKGRILAESPEADGSAVFIHPTQRKVLAVAFTRARQQWKVLDRRFRRDFEGIKKLADGEANVIDATLDMKTWVVAVSDDDGPVRYYLWNRKARKNKGTFLFTNRKALEKLELAQMHAVTVKSRDGLELVDYLSLPPAADPDGDGRPAEALPMVLLVHGGPWARDYWGYNPLHQLLANRGYAVLAVNFRGSTGLGKKFLNAGNREWGAKMHDDLIDSVKWAVDQKIADPDKVCIMGGSYGGYATLVGLTATPETFACGVDIVGPSNLLTLIHSVPPYWKPMLAVFKDRIGDWTTPEGKKMLEERSPLNHVDRIVRPLLIGQGANDPRVKQAESDRIARAMKDRGIPVSYIVFPDEGHGFRRVPNRLAFWAATEAFLSAHLGGKYQPVEPGEIEGTTMKVPDGVYGIPGFPALMKALGQ